MKPSVKTTMPSDRNTPTTRNPRRILTLTTLTSSGPGPSTTTTTTSTQTSKTKSTHNKTKSSKATASVSPESSSSTSTSSSGSASGGVSGSDDALSKSLSKSSKPSEKDRNRRRNSKVVPQDLREILSFRYYCSTVTFRHYDQIIPGLYLGGMKAAKNILCLEKMGITHILNAAYVPSPYTDIWPSKEYYDGRNFHCDFLGIAAQDFPSYKIGIYFEETTNFIHEALKSNGKVLVHCQVGVSRSATLVIAYLMMKRKMSAEEAVTLVGAIRPIFPNEGFLKQICELECRLKNPRNTLVRSLSTVSRRTFRKVFSRN